MKGYAILTEKDNLKLLCFRSGFFIKKELDIPNINLKIDEKEKYEFYELELKELPLYLNKIFSVLRRFIEGILITYKLD
jgi:hypothetical protein